MKRIQLRNATWRTNTKSPALPVAMQWKGWSATKGDVTGIQEEFLNRNHYHIADGTVYLDQWLVERIEFKIAEANNLATVQLLVVE